MNVNVNVNTATSSSLIHTAPACCSPRASQRARSGSIQVSSGSSVWQHFCIRCTGASIECCVLRSASYCPLVRLCTCHPVSAHLKPGHMCGAQGASEAAPRTRLGALSLQPQQYKNNPFASSMQGQTKASRLRASSKPGPQSATSANEDGIGKSKPSLQLAISGFSVGVLPEHAKTGYRRNKRRDGAV